MLRFTILLMLGTTAGSPLLAADTPVDFFEKKIRPVLVDQCVKCHSVEAQGKGKLRGGLLLDSKAGWQNGGDSGPAIVPGKPNEGTFLSALLFTHDIQMPPSGKLPDAVVNDFRTWITNGAADPRSGKPGTALSVDLAKGKEFWAFQAPKLADLSTTGSHRIDTLIRAKLAEQNLPPAPPADPRILVRRLHYDLIGLPPSPRVVEDFVQNPTPQAYQDLVNRLLQSPAYGERWARLWLDVARYAEDQAHIVGSDTSLTYPNAYLYRDWVIQAFNQDMPYDRFVSLQLAADLLEGNDSANIAALGFIGLGPKYYSRGTLAVMADEWEDRVDVVSRGLLGLTVACARCHDHKFDPIPQADYYSLAGVFAGTQMFNRPLDTIGKKTVGGNAKKPEEAIHIVKEGKPTDLNLFVRGDVTNKGPVTKRHFLSVLSNAKPFTQGSGRLELAQAIVDPKNPLTARVIVNRIWAAYFGRGLVGTASNFGALGERPTHPNLLDDLAVRFMQNQWSLKWLHREIVTSATYQQSSLPHPVTEEADPDNRLLGAMPRRRLGAEGWRDTLLSVTGRLEASAVGGPSMDPLDPQAGRRTIYSRVSRLELNRYLSMFDFPDPNVTADKRAETTTPLQKLFVMNSAYMVRRAKELSQRLFEDVPDLTSAGTAKRIDRAYRLLYGRSPVEAELKLGTEFLSAGDDQAERWTEYCHVLLASNELAFVD